MTQGGSDTTPTTEKHEQRGRDRTGGRTPVGEERERERGREAEDSDLFVLKRKNKNKRMQEDGQVL